MALTAALSVALPAVWSIVAPTPAYAATVAGMCTMTANCTRGHEGECCGDPGAAAMICIVPPNQTMGTCSGVPAPGQCPAMCT
jgi:hypothetical protein